MTSAVCRDREPARSLPTPPASSADYGLFEEAVLNRVAPELGRLGRLAQRGGRRRA